MSEKNEKSGKKARGKTMVGSTEAGREVLEATQKATTTPATESSKLTDLLNLAAALPKPEAPSAKVEKVVPSLKQEEEAGRQLVKQLTPHFAALMATEAELADAKKTSTKGDGNIFVTEETLATLEQMRQDQITKLEKRVEELKSMLQPFFNAASGLRKMLEMNFEASQKRAVSEQANQATIDRVKELAAKNFESGVTPGRVSVFLEKAARMIGVLDRVPDGETSGLKNSDRVMCHRFTQDVTYGGFMADFRKEAVAEAKAEGKTTGYIKAEVWFRADLKNARPGIIAIGIARAKEREIFEANKARKDASSVDTATANAK